MDPTYHQLCQGQTLGTPVLEVSEIGGTQGTQHVYYQFDQGQASYTSSQIQDFPVGVMINGPEIGGTYAAQQAYNHIDQGQNFCTTGASMLKVSEIGSTNRIQQVCHQLGQGASCTPVATTLEAANIGGPKGTRQEVPMGTMNGEPVIGGTGIQAECYPIGQYQGSLTSVTAKRELFKVEESLSGHHQAFSTPVRTTQKALDFRGTELPEGGEEEGASQTYQNQHTPYDEEQTDAVSDPHKEARACRKVIPRTCVLNQQNENILSCKSGSDANNLQGKAVLGSLTPEEKKRLNDRRYRDNVKAKNQKLRDDFQSVSKENEKLKEKLQSALKETEKAVFELNFNSIEDKAEAMKMVGGLPDMAKITLNVTKRRLKLKGDFDAEAVLLMLKMCCDARLASKEYVSGMPAPSASESLRVSAVQLR